MMFKKKILSKQSQNSFEKEQCWKTHFLMSKRNYKPTVNKSGTGIRIGIYIQQWNRLEI